MDRETYVQNSHAAYNGASVEPPNARLSLLLARLNAQSIVVELAGQPAFAAHRYALLATAGTGCGPLADFYPLSLRVAVESELREFAQSSAAADRRQSKSKRLRLAAGERAYNAGAAPIELNELRFVAEKGLNLSTQHWTLALERGTYDLSETGGLALERALFELVGRSDEAVRNLAAYRTFDSADAYCKYLRQESRRALGVWYGAQTKFALVDSERAAFVISGATSPGVDTAGGQPKLLERCIGCHSGDIAPALPFADRSALASRLLGGHYPRGRLLDEILYRLTPEAGADSMPRGSDLSAAEREALESYFLTLARETATR